MFRNNDVTGCMNISIICSSTDHPVYQYLENWCELNSVNHTIELVTEVNDLSGGDFLFLVSCGDYITKNLRSCYNYTLVLHASKLPEGRGWSPHIWDLLQDKGEIYLTLLEAEDSIDTGDIWLQEKIPIEPHELFDEINQKLFEREIYMIDFAIKNHNNIVPISQEYVNDNVYRKRTPEDSKLDPHKSISEQFALIRLSDPDRYPAFFNLHGKTYEIIIKKK